MSGGIAYVLDEDNDLYMRTNKSMVFSEEVTNKYDVLELKEMIKEHVTLTNSEKGKEILDHFSEYLPKFKKVIPYDYNRMQMAIVQMEEKGLNAEQAQIEAFYASTRAKGGKKQWESQQDLWNTTDVRRVRWNQRNESKILMNSTSSFPKKNKESRQRAVWIAVSRSVSRV